MSRRNRFQIRLLPVAIFVLVLMLGVRVGNLWMGLPGWGVTPSLAQQATPAAKAQSQSQASASQPAAGAATKGPKKTGSKTDVAKSGSDSAKSDGLPDDPTLYSQAEIDLLQKLADRRAKLDKWAHQLDMREELLKAAEQRIDRKVAELHKIQTKLQGMLGQYDKIQENKLKSLVKIYEAMKPKDAARIFMQLDMPVLLDVVERMNERKVAAILAQLAPEKAKKVTDQLIARRKIGAEVRQKLPSAAAGNGPLPSSGKLPGNG